MVCGSSATVGVLRAMSTKSWLQRWLASGSTRSLNPIIPPVITAATARSGRRRRLRSSPPAFIAVISFSAVKVAKV